MFEIKLNDIAVAAIVHMQTAMDIARVLSTDGKSIVVDMDDDRIIAAYRNNRKAQINETRRKATES